MMTAPAAETDAFFARCFEDTEAFHRAFSAGAFLTPATFESAMAVQRLKEAGPLFHRLAAGSKPQEDEDTLGELAKLMGLLIATNVIREALNAGAWIEQPKTKTPGNTPKG